MSFFRKLFSSDKLDGAALARSAERADYAQIALLAYFTSAKPLPEAQEQQRWNRVLPRPYGETLALLQKQGWLTVANGQHVVTPAATPILALYQQRQATEKAAAMPPVRAALQRREASEALELRRAYEARQPLGQADWTGPDPQLSHSALTRRILFLQHWLLDGLGKEATEWLKLYAAEQHLWGTSWRLALAEIPAAVQQELLESVPQLDAVEVAYWKAYQLALYVENQETWQRCKGGDHVRRIELVGPADEFTCEHCRSFLGKQFLVVRVPELPPRACNSSRGCRCRYEPVLESYEQ
jgi:hypothetical protein